MNSIWKNVLLISVVTIWLLFLGYALSCFVAYIIGWPPFVAPVILTVLSFIAIIVGFISKRSKGSLVKPIFFVMFISLFISSLGNAIILGVKFDGREYSGNVIGSDGYLYNKFGYKILNIQGRLKYSDEVVYVETKNRVFVVDYDGDVLANEAFIEEMHQGRAIVLQHPFTEKYLIMDESSLVKDGYDSYDYLGESYNYDYFKCCKNGLWDLVRVGKKYGGWVFYGRAHDIEEFGYPIRCFVIQDGKKYKILSSDNSDSWEEENGVNHPYWTNKDNRLHYKDNNGESWFIQLED